MADEREQPEEISKGETNFHMRVTNEWVDHLKTVADYAAKRGVIPEDTRGNMAAWVNYCLNHVERLLMQEYKKAGV